MGLLCAVLYVALNGMDGFEIMSNESVFVIKVVHMYLYCLVPFDNKCSDKHF